MRLPLLAYVSCICVLSTCIAAGEVGPGVVLHRLTEDGKSYLERGARLAPRGDWLCFYRDVTPSRRELCIMKSDGSEQRVVNRGTWPWLAAWCPDGTKLAFAESTGTDGECDTAIYVFDLEKDDLVKLEGGYRKEQIGVGPGTPIIWSPNGSQFTLVIKEHLWVFGLDGSRPTEMAPAHLDASVGWHPLLWSPDGERLAFRSRRSEGAPANLWVSNADASGLVQLTPDGHNPVDPAWSPDGEWIAFGSLEGRLVEEVERGMRDIWVVKPDGSDLHPITHGSDLSSEKRMLFWDASWLPDSKTVRCRGRRYDLGGRAFTGAWLVDSTTGEGSQIMGDTPEGTDATFGDWYTLSPDGRLVAHSATRYTLSPDGRLVAHSATRYTVSGRGGGAETYTEGRTILEVYAFATGELLPVVTAWWDTERLDLFPQGGEPSWTEDGRRLLVDRANITSLTDWKMEPDIYVAELPEAWFAAAVAVTEAPPEAAPEPLAPEAAPTALTSMQIVLLANRDASNVLEILPPDNRTYCTVDTANNAIVICATPELVGEISDRIVTLDKPTPHVQVEVLVAELTEEAARDLGLDWAWAKGRFGAALPLADSGLGEITYQGVGKLDREFFVTLQALQTSGHVTIMASPRIVSLSGETAHIRIRREHNFFIESVTTGGLITKSRADITADVDVNITALLLGNGFIDTTVTTKAENFVFKGASSLPDRTSRDVKTRVVVPAGSSLIIGGLLQREESRSVSKVPILCEIPLLGNLFKKTHRESRETMLAVFVTPTQVDNTASALPENTNGPPAPGRR